MPKFPKVSRDVITPVNPQTQAQQTVVWSKLPLELPKVLHGTERFDGAPLKMKHSVPTPGQRRALVSAECGAADAHRWHALSPFAAAEKNILRLSKGTRHVVIGSKPVNLETHSPASVPWDQLFQVDNSNLHSSSCVPTFDDMVRIMHKSWPLVFFS